VTSLRLNERGWCDTDTPLLQEALAEREVHAQLVPWHENVDWASYALTVLRSPWDMFSGHLDEFFAWLERVETQTVVLNAPSIVRRVLDKHYLKGLAAAGVPVISTDFIEVGQRARFPDVGFVVKPAISGGASYTAQYRTDDVKAAATHVEYLHKQGLAEMVQPYMSSIDTQGERALMFFNDVYHHAIVKQAILQPDESFEVIHKLHPGPRHYQPTLAEQSAARAALAVMSSPDELLSGRVDMVVDANGDPAIMELELIAPVLFLTHSDGAVEHFAEAICQRLDCV
ncbi:MAG: ATP-grasp domain-containing protein, partial [Mycobacteriales bacterium]